MFEQAVIILAAGEGRRLGGVAKALLPINGNTFLQRIWTTAQNAGVSHGIVVTAAPFAVAVESHALSLGLQVAMHDQPHRGMGFSVAVGFLRALQLPLSVQVAWLWPVDHPRVQSQTLIEMSRAFDLQTHDGVVAVCADAKLGGDVRGGHPLLLHRNAWQAMTCAGDEPAGARTILQRLQLHRMVVQDSGVLRDVDHPEDLPT